MGYNSVKWGWFVYVLKAGEAIYINHARDVFNHMARVQKQEQNDVTMVACWEVEYHGKALKMKEKLFDTMIRDHSHSNIFKYSEEMVRILEGKNGWLDSIVSSVGGKEVKTFQSLSAKIKHHKEKDRKARAARRAEKLAARGNKKVKKGVAKKNRVK